MFGLDPDTERNIKQAFAEIPVIDKVILYGSRAKGSYRNGSDIDITLFGDKLTLSNSVYPLTDELEELNLPYMFDISIFSHIDNEDLIEHIHRAGKVLYLKEKGLPKGDALSLPKGDALSLPKGGALSLPKGDALSLPKGWEVKKLGEVCDILDKLRKPITKRNRVEGEYPYYGATGILSYVHEYIFDEKLVLIGEDGAKWKSGDNSSFIVSGKYWVNNHAHVIRPIRNSMLDEWVVNFLNFSDLTQYITGMTVPKLNQKKMKNIPIPLPPLPEQKRIVAILEKAFTAIDKAKANTEKNLKNARELFQSKLQETFANGKLKIDNGEWEEKKLGEVASVEYGYTDQSTMKGDYRYIRITDIDQNGELIITNKKYIKYSKGIERFVLDDNDLLMARTGATFAKVLLYKDYEISVFASYLIKIKFTEKIENALYWYFAKTRDYWQQANTLSSGAAQPHFNGVALKKVIFTYPKSVSKQKLLIQKFKNLSTETKKLEAIYQRKITCLDELKKSILQKAFNGELLNNEV